MSKLLTLRDAADRTGISVWTWRHWVAARRVPCVRLGRRVLLEEAVVEAIIARGRQEADPAWAAVGKALVG